MLLPTVAAQEGQAAPPDTVFLRLHFQVMVGLGRV